MLTLGIMCGGREYVLNALDTNPTWQRTRLKSPEGAASLLVGIAKGVCLNEASALILPDIQKYWATFSEANGPPPANPGDEWYEAHDDGLMAIFEPYENLLSGSWLAFVSTDIRLWQLNEDEKLANSFAQEVWKQLTWKRTDNQILAGVGIVHADLTRYGYMPPPVETPIKPEFDPMSVNAVLNRIMMSMPDMAQLAEDLDFVSDDDDALAAGALARLGLADNDRAILVEARSLSGAAPEAWFNAIEAGELLDEKKNYVDLSGRPDRKEPDLGPNLPASLVRNPLPPLPPLPGAANASAALPPIPSIPARPLPPLPPSSPGPSSTGVGAAPAPTRGGRKTKTSAEAPAGAIPVDVLRSIKDHSGVKDEDLADIMGVSRPTLGNIMKGKVWYVPTDPSRRQALLNMVALHTRELTAAYNAINA